MRRGLKLSAVKQPLRTARSLSTTGDLKTRASVSDLPH